MQINSTSTTVAASNLKANTAQQSSVEEEIKASTLEADKVSISAEAQEAQLQSGSGGGTWPKNPK